MGKDYVCVEFGPLPKLKLQESVRSPFVQRNHENIKVLRRKGNFITTKHRK